MPTIFRMFELKVIMNNRGREHNPPHVHAYFKDDLAVIDIESSSVIHGSIPSNQLQIVKRFIEENRAELLTLWEEDPQNFERFK